MTSTVGVKAAFTPKLAGEGGDRGSPHRVPQSWVGPWLEVHFSEAVCFVLSPTRLTLPFKIRGDLDFSLMDSGC